MQENWFEMRDIRRRKLDNAVWIPLRAAHRIQAVGKYGFLGYREEFYGVGSLAIPLDSRTEAEKLSWMDVGIGRDHSAFVENGHYHPADAYESYDGDLSGVSLALDQRGNREEPNQWHLHQDFVIAMRLRREGNTWLEGFRG